MMRYEASNRHSAWTGVAPAPDGDFVEYAEAKAEIEKRDTICKRLADEVERLTEKARDIKTAHDIMADRLLRTLRTKIDNAAEIVSLRKTTAEAVDNMTKLEKSNFVLHARVLTAERKVARQQEMLDAIDGNFAEVLNERNQLRADKTALLNGMLQASTILHNVVEGAE